MSTIQVQGLQSLKGEVRVQGSKNAVLPMMAASILHKGITVITNVPGIQDVFCMMGILEYMGCKCTLNRRELVIDASVLTSTCIPELYVKSMRSSIMVLGALLGRAGEASTYYPGGCIIGKRPINIHLQVLRELGAEIETMNDQIQASAVALTGAEIELPFPSVGATENGILAAVAAEGITTLRGCAKEPEIEELCLFLNHMGADIKGIGTSELTIYGKTLLHDSSYRVTGDRIVAGTYLSAAMICEGDVELTGVKPAHLETVLHHAERMGARISYESDRFRIQMTGRPKPSFVRTSPYPGFPTDLQSPMLAVMAVAEGDSRIEENVFEGRFGAAKELQKMGAEIIISERQAYIHGTYPLRGAVVEAADLRGGAALVVAGLVAEGITEIGGCCYIERGYEDICKDLSDLGARVMYHNLPSLKTADVR